jgi:hypothetical protein
MIDWQAFLLLPAASESYSSSVGRLSMNCGWLCKWQRRRIDLFFFVFMTRRCVHCGSLLWGMPHGPNLGCKAVIKILTRFFITRHACFGPGFIPLSRDPLLYQFRSGLLQRGSWCSTCWRRAFAHDHGIRCMIIVLTPCTGAKSSLVCSFVQLFFLCRIEQQFQLWSRDYV